MVLYHQFELEIVIVTLLASALRLTRHSDGWYDNVYRRYSLDYAWHLLMVNASLAARELRRKLFEALSEDEELRVKFSDFMAQYHARNTCSNHICHVPLIVPQIERAIRLGQAYDGYALALKPPVPLALRLTIGHSCSSHNITPAHRDYAPMLQYYRSANLIYRALEHPDIQDSVWVLRFNLHSMTAFAATVPDDNALIVTPRIVGPCKTQITRVDLGPFLATGYDDVYSSTGPYDRFRRSLCNLGICKTCDQVTLHRMSKAPRTLEKLRMIVLAHHLHMRFSEGGVGWDDVETSLLRASDALSEE